MARRRHYREMRKSILLVVEGETELIYFNQMKADYRIPHLSIEPKISPRKDPLSLVQRAIMENDMKDFDITWCVFDEDVIKQLPGIFSEAKKLASKHKFIIAESYPCFEVWFLMHFIYSTRQYNNGKEVVSELCKYIEDYCKEQNYLRRNNLFLLLKDQLNTAIENCKKIEQYNQESDIKNGTKSDIFKIIELIRKIR